MASVNALTRVALVPLVCSLLAGCFSAASTSPSRALHLWRQQSNATQTPGLVAQADGTLTIHQAQAVQLALRQNPELAVQTARVQQAQAQVDEASQLENPELRVSDAKMDSLLEGEARLEMGLRVPVPHPASRSARKDRARLEAEKEAAQARVARRQVRSQVLKAFARLAWLQEDEAQLKKAVALYTEQTQLLRGRVEAGVATQADLSLAALQQAEAADELEALKVERQTLAVRLRRLLGLAAATPVRFVPEPLPVGSAAQDWSGRDRDLDTLVQTALQQRSELHAAAAAVEAAEAKSYLARVQRWPWFKFAQVGYELAPDSGARDFTFSLALELPLLSWNSGAMAALEAAAQRRRAEEEATVTHVAYQVTEALARARQSAVRLQQMEQGLLPAAQEGARVMAQAAQTGAVDALKTAVAKEKQVRAQRQYLKARLLYQNALIDFNAALEAQGQTNLNTQPDGGPHA